MRHRMALTYPSQALFRITNQELGSPQSSVCLSSSDLKKQNKKTAVQYVDYV